MFLNRVAISGDYKGASIVFDLDLGSKRFGKAYSQIY